MEVLTGYLIEMIFAALIVLAGLAWNTFRTYVKDKRGIDLGQFFDITAIPDALSYGEKIAKEKVGDMVSELEFKNEAINSAIDFMTSQFPIWLKDYGITEENLKTWIEAEFEKRFDSMSISTLVNANSVERIDEEQPMSKKKKK